MFLKNFNLITLTIVYHFGILILSRYGIKEGEDKMYCDKCGAKISDGAKFCPECGNAIDVTKVESVSSDAAKKDETVRKIRKTKTAHLKMRANCCTQQSGRRGRQAAR